MIHQTQEFGKATRPLFADPVTYEKKLQTKLIKKKKEKNCKEFQNCVLWNASKMDTKRDVLS